MTHVTITDIMILRGQTMAFDSCFGFDNPDSVTLPVQLNGTEQGT